METKDRVKSYVMENDGTTTSEIANDLEISVSSARKAISSLGCARRQAHQPLPLVLLFVLLFPTIC